MRRRPDDTLEVIPLAKLLELVGGLALVILGIVGLILPILPGWVFLIPGLLILARHFHWARRLVQWAEQMRDKATGKRVDVDKEKQS
jgi:uncharacterized membrane protein YbaN (DUF454 family)